MSERRTPAVAEARAAGPRTSLYRVGIIGYGRIGRRRAALVEAHPRLALVAVADTHLEEDGSLRASCRRHRSGADLLSDDVDAVFVCTPNAATTDLVVEAINAGKHVFAEKPPGRTASDVQRIRDAEARRPDLTVKFGFNHREHDSVRLSQALINSGELGRLMWMRGTYGKAGGPGYEGDWRADPETAGGGILLDQGIHMLDLFRLFGGDFVEVKSFVGQSFWKAGLEDNAFALLRAADGRVAMLHSSATHWNHTFRLEVYLSEGYLVLEGFLTGSMTYGRETLSVGRRDWSDEDSARGQPREERYYFDDDRSWEREVDDFVRCLSTGSPVANGSSLDAQRAMELVMRVYADDGWGGVR
jgi:predicted dehydrogenase